MCVVPIRVSHGETKKEISTYAMLDNCSQGCFIKENLKRRFRVTGSKTAIIIKTLNGEEEIESSVATGLRIGSSGVEDRSNWLNLPATYTRTEIPADVDEVATKEKIESSSRRNSQ